jgi:hypothetical protein
VRCLDRCSSAALLCVALMLGCEPDIGDSPVPGPPDDHDLAAVQAWLYAGSYLEWERYDPEPGPGMTGGARVYVSPELAASLRAGASVHPIGSAAVREIIDAEQPEQMLGWALLHKLESEGGGEAWFFYEVFSTEPDAAPLVAERGAAGCVGCHQAGVDYVQSQLP